MFDSIVNVMLFRKHRVNLAGKKLIKIIETEMVEGFLEVLLKLMGLMLCIDKDFQRNIIDFDAKYMFEDKSKGITISAVFNELKLKVKKTQISDANIKVIFKDQKALMNFLLSPKPDILSAILDQDVTYEGNLNYLSKFAYMANHLKLMFI